ncbi:MAG TPA: CDP-alcohol phosphatidyltransferase family protein [Nocardioidaceae bacterium]|jgi:CDP-diacylglycerol--glycerol-3-phosphate 3-phosphatidyltransferase|nr:CDP-alcohol phosphatidyltransferase family protein [Nocardioidaceae bacterium]
MATYADSGLLDVWTDQASERLGTSATVVTAVRTVASVAVAGAAVREGSLTLLVVALAIYWVGDVLDGLVARVRGCETRIGAVLDILSDRLCAATFYLGLIWLEPAFVLPVLVYLAEFMVVDAYLSLAFLAWPIRSPNYFYVVDRTLWLWNWSKPGKAANSAIFAVILLVTGNVWVGTAIALALLTLKCLSLARLARLGLPVPPR